jgi:ABC-type transport system substrate-binding protein
MTFMSMNLAIPPLDDVHVRKAVSLVVDKQALRRLIVSSGSELIGPLSGDYAGHIVVDSLEDNLLLAYDPYATPGHRGSLPLARAEMAKSRYDRNRDGVCDARDCRRLRAVTSSEASGLRLLRVIQRNLASIGLQFAEVQKLSDTEMFRTLADPRAKIAMGLASGWAKDFPNASSFLPPLFSRSRLGGPPPLPLVPPNASLVGAGPEQLRRWGYRVTSVPDLEAKIEQCLPIVGPAQAQCWAEADQFLMEKIVPVVPVMFLHAVRTVSARVASYSFAQSDAFPALDRITLRQP